jgi:hypothetical protein
MTTTKFGYFFTESLTSNKAGYITVAITRPSRETEDQQHLAAFSFCSPKDQFNKALGRKVAESRLKSKKALEIRMQGSVADVVEEAMHTAIREKLVPSWVAKAYKRELIGYGLDRNGEVECCGGCCCNHC